LSSHQAHNDIDEVYFCTITCYKWVPLFEESQAYNSVYRWFEHLKDDGCLVLAYVIMPNHFHVLLFPSHKGTSLNKMVGEGKRFMAYDIVNGLKRLGNTAILKILEKGVATKEKIKKKKHQVFHPSFDARVCFDEAMIEQKLDYIHHNPVSGKWNLVDDFVKYPHSSAQFYESETHGSFEVTHYKDLFKE
jgi:REP element-mobilizing transposase RayT